MLALAFFALALAQSEIGRIIASDGHTESRLEREIVIGNDVFLVPENAIRFGQARRDGVQPRLDLYLHWPGLEGYAPETKDAFNHADGGKSIIFVTLEPATISRDMSGRLEAVYRHVLAPGAADGPADLRLRRFEPDSGYVDEILAVGERSGEPPFVARCLSGELAAGALAPCSRDVLLTDEISITYRFAEELLGDWRALDEAVTTRMRAFLQTADA